MASRGIAEWDVILKLGLDPEAALVVQAGKLITQAMILRDYNEIRAIALVLGG